VTCGFAGSRPAPSRRPRAASQRSVRARRRASARARIPSGRRIFSSCPCSPPSLPLRTRPQVAGRARLGYPARAPWRTSAVLAGAPVPFARRLSAPPASRLLRARLPREVPGFGAVLIACSARVMDRGTGLPADLRSVAEPAAGGETVVRLGACSRPAVDRRHVFGCLLDREGSESPLSPQSLPIRLDREGSRFRSSPHSVPLSSSPCLGKRDPRHGTRIPVGDLRAAAGTRWELGRNPSGTCVAAHEAAGQAVPRFDRHGGPSWRSGSESRPSPIQRRATGLEALRLEGEESGEPSGSTGQEGCREGQASWEQGSAGLDSEDTSGTGVRA